MLVSSSLTAMIDYIILNLPFLRPTENYVKYLGPMICMYVVIDHVDWPARIFHKFPVIAN
jgi:hypothetical protein